MKLTEANRKFIFTELYKYAEQIGITVETFPEILLSRKEVMNHAMTIGKTTTGRYYGFCQRKQRLIFINVKKAENRKGLRETIVHELVHYRFPYMGHGSKFHGRIDEIIKKGKKYPPYKPKKKDSEVSGFAISA